jgi:hypothetical protein
MAFIPALNTLRVAVQYISDAGEDAVNVFHFRDALGAITLSRVNTLFALLDTWYTENWAPTASAHWQTDIYTAVDLTAAEGALYTHVVATSGENNLGALPAQNTVAISLRTGLSGRSRRGRLYHVGLSKDQVVNSTLASGVAASLISAYTVLLTVTGLDDWEWVVASYVSNGAPRAAALLTPITQVILTDPVVDSMDTRKPSGL